MKHPAVTYAPVLFAREAQMILRNKCMTCGEQRGSNSLFCPPHEDLGYALLDKRLAKEKAPTP